MNLLSIARRRLRAQHVSAPKSKTPEEVVSSLGAVQAQDFSGALWGIGLRLSAAKVQDVERAIADRSIVRTWTMRGTLHFVGASDVRWMLELLAPRVVRTSAGRMRAFGIDDAVLGKSGEVVREALRGGRLLTRPELYAALERSGVSTSGGRGLQILWRLAHDGHLCLASRRGKQHTFALLEEWVPRGKSRGREDAREELAIRYFTGHGPATVRDFSWWSGLSLSESRQALEAVSHHLSKEAVGEETYWSPPEAPDLPRADGGFLLPPFDELMVGYSDRSSVLDPARDVPDPSLLLGPVAMVDGRMVGTWRGRTTKHGVRVALDPLTHLTPAQRRALFSAADAYGRFLGVPSQVALEG